jgi:hypothetical protein
MFFLENGVVSHSTEREREMERERERERMKAHCMHEVLSLSPSRVCFAI